MRAILFALSAGDARLAARTRRSLLSAGVAHVEEAADLAESLRSVEEPVWCLRAGVWRSSPGPMREIPPSTSGLPLFGFGRTEGAKLEYYSLYLDPAAAHALADALAASIPWAHAVRKTSRLRTLRCVSLHDVDVCYDPRLRAVQLVTTIQIGGAERMALDFAHEFNRTGTATLVAALAAPTRRSFPVPPHFVDLSRVRNDAESRAAAVFDVASRWGADFVHAHLVRADEAAAIRARGVPLMVTVHNLSASWPIGYAEATEPFADRLLGCSRAVTRDVQALLPHSVARTVWNGIDPHRFKPAARDPKGEFVLLTVANPRRQKRLDRLPEILAKLARRLAPRRVKLVLAGEPSAAGEDGREAVALFEAELERWGIREAAHWTGAVDDVAPLLAEADVFISASEVEGLSLAQLEALAAGLPVVATDVGGAAEVAARGGRIRLMPKDAPAEDFVHALEDVAREPGPRASTLPADFTRECAAAQARLHGAGLLVHSERGGPVWLITNNFSTGGAQTSARRLLLGLAEKGVRVRVATIEEWPDRPTPGRSALEEAGVPVVAVRPSTNARRIAEALIADITCHPPSCVYFWNLIAPVKIILAEILVNIPIYDVSPGAMYFRSLERHFGSPLAGLPIASAREYGTLLTGAVVKYAAELDQARETMGSTMHKISNGVPISPARPPRSGRELVIGTAARLSPDKRLDLLFAALHRAHSRMPRYRVLIAGGPEQGSERHPRELRRLARGLPVKWCGELEDTSEFLAGLDLFAMISEPAGCPNASLEAMGAGLPVVATDHGGASEQVLDGITGRLVGREDVEAFAEALVQLAHDPALRGRLGAAARERAATEFSMERMVSAYAALAGAS
jgi:glycosyltransferase involved in cell wall biosynthesis